MNCEFGGCTVEVRANPNDHQCDSCLKVVCSKHGRRVSDGYDPRGRFACIRCKPRSTKTTRRREPNGTAV